MGLSRRAWEPGGSCGDGEAVDAGEVSLVRGGRSGAGQQAEEERRFRSLARRLSGVGISGNKCQGLNHVFNIEQRNFFHFPPITKGNFFNFFPRRNKGRNFTSKIKRKRFFWEFKKKKKGWNMLPTLGPREKTWSGQVVYVDVIFVKE
jgi:hypothetical protein